jgi:hypothetical protein
MHSAGVLSEISRSSDRKRDWKLFARLRARVPRALSRLLRKSARGCQGKQSSAQTFNYAGIDSRHHSGHRVRKYHLSRSVSPTIRALHRIALLAHCLAAASRSQRIPSRPADEEIFEDMAALAGMQRTAALRTGQTPLRDHCLSLDAHDLVFGAAGRAGKWLCIRGHCVRRCKSPPQCSAKRLPFA